jgi:sarcosine oxidase, subunit gamma
MNHQAPRRRSPVHDGLACVNPTWTTVRDMPAVLHFQNGAAEVQLRERLALCDVSCFERMSVKGPGAARHLEDCGVPLPATLYEYLQSDDRGLIVRVDSQEFFLEDALESRLVDLLKSRLEPASPGVYPVHRQDAAFWLTGNKATQVLAQTCGLNFQKPGPQWIFSRVAGVSCGLLPWRLERTPVFRIWTDASYGAYLWEELLKIVREQEGDAVGLGCFFPQLKSSVSHPVTSPE